jgi:DNA-damage-inducible protein D
MKSEEIQGLFAQFEEAAAEVEGVECWSARELQKLLGYAQWRNFEAIIDKAKDACRNAGENVAYHFADVSKMVEIGSGAEKQIVDTLLTRYACYLVAQNGDSRKEQIAFEQSYIAVQTRRAEVIEKRLRTMSGCRHGPNWPRRRRNFRVSSMNEEWAIRISPLSDLKETVLFFSWIQLR